MGVSTFKRTRIVLGKDGAGQDFKAYGDTPGAYIHWDHANNQLKFIGTFSGVMDLSSVTLTPDPTRTNFAIAVGSRANPLTVTMTAATSRNLNPIQICADIVGANPTNASSVSLIRMQTTHSDAAMSYLRLRHINSYMYIEKDLQDAYIYTGSMDFYTNAIAVSGEAAVMNLNMECSSAVTGNVRGLIVNMYGAGLPSTSIGVEVRTDGGVATLGEGIRIWTVGGNSITTGLTFTGNIAHGINLSGITLAPNSGRTNYALALGTRTAEVTVNLANAATQHFELFQTNLNLTGTSTGPTDASQVSLMRLRTTHDTTNMAYLRLRNIHSYMDIKKNLQDAYGATFGVDFYTNAVEVGGEAAILNLNMECNSAVTGDVRGVIINMYGAGLPSTTSIGLEVRTDGGSATLTEGIRIWGVGANAITTGIKMQGTLATCFNFTSVVTGVDDTDTEGSRNGRIAVVDRNGDTKYILLYDGS